MAARPIGSGNVSFGLVSIPVKLYTAVSAENVSFNMLHKACGSRLKQQLVCASEGVVVERADTIRGFEHARDQYVKFTDEELKSLEAARSDILELLEFVPADTVDFLFIEKTYFLGPDKGGDRAYSLLSQAMHQAKRIAVGRFQTRGKDNLVLVRPYKAGLVLHQCFYENEVRSFDDVPTGGAFEFKDIELELADKLIENLAKDTFDPSQYHDTYRESVKAAVEKKIAGEEVVVAAEPPKAHIVDLLEALKKSVAAVQNNVDKVREDVVDAMSGTTQPRPPKKAELRKKAEPKKAEPKKRARGG
jgi:DNA end-binding protein Ku